MALFGAGIAVELREVSLKNKPRGLLDISAKGTVPVLQLADTILDESLDIMLWALRQQDPDLWYQQYSKADKADAMALIDNNDCKFKFWLDKYKYAERFPEQSPQFYRGQFEVFLAELEHRLGMHDYLVHARPTLADIAIFPFIRQFSMVDKHWFDQCPYPRLQYWLHTLLDLPLFSRVMAKTPGT